MKRVGIFSVLSMVAVAILLGASPALAETANSAKYFLGMGGMGIKGAIEIDPKTMAGGSFLAAGVGTVKTEGYGLDYTMFDDETLNGVYKQVAIRYASAKDSVAQASGFGIFGLIGYSWKFGPVVAGAGIGLGYMTVSGSSSSLNLRQSGIATALDLSLGIAI